MIGLAITAVLLVVTLPALVYRMVAGPTIPDRALASDFILFVTIGLIALLGVALASSATFDLVLVATAVGFLATLALARLITRQKR
ncbi:MAG TPA: monovalent cation/H+ antiporter complex subunit F [Actinomycetospora sp.]|nr:monovalent cation/H+ antiporter complex subunit F [Actinomycetospora sp.]